MDTIITPTPKNIKSRLRDELKESKCSECGMPINEHGNVENFFFNGGSLICPVNPVADTKDVA